MQCEDKDSELTIRGVKFLGLAFLYGFLSMLSQRFSSDIILSQNPKCSVDDASLWGPVVLSIMCDILEFAIRSTAACLKSQPASQQHEHEAPVVGVAPRHMGSNSFCHLFKQHLAVPMVKLPIFTFAGGLMAFAMTQPNCTAVAAVQLFSISSAISLSIALLLLLATWWALRKRYPGDAPQGDGLDIPLSSISTPII